VRVRLPERAEAAREWLLRDAWQSRCPAATNWLAEGVIKCAEKGVLAGAFAVRSPPTTIGGKLMFN
jgi:hypothetical protein